MTIWKRWIQRSVLWGVGALVLGGLVACSMIASPPVGQIAQNDHAALVAWYDKEAAQLRQKAKDMEEMAERYQKNPQLAHTEGVGGSHKTNFAQHCQALVGMYTKAAEEADELSREHRGMLK